MKPVKFHELPKGSLYRIFAERKVVYEQCERKEKFVRSKDYTVYLKHGASHSTSKAGKAIILSPHDLVVAWVDKRGTK